jgi:peroxiredoxin
VTTVSNPKSELMRMKTRILVTAVAVTSLVLLAFGIAILYMQNAAGPQQSSMEFQRDTDLTSQHVELPNWNLTLSNESTVELNQLRGQVLIVELMATWCSACESQIANFQDFLGIRTEGVSILALTVDVSETPQMMANYKTNHGFTWACGVAGDGTFAEYLDVTVVPTIVIIDGSGYLRFIHEGTWSASSMDATLTSIGL